MGSYSEIEQLVERYDTSIAGLDQAVSDRISASLDASYRNLAKELAKQYPKWQSQGSLYASQRRLLLMQELGPLLNLVRPDQAAEYEKLFAETIQLSHETGATLADELVNIIDPGYPLQDFASIPIEAAVLQAQDGAKRLSRYSDEFKAQASGIIEQSLIQGWGAKKVQGLLEKELGVTKSKAETLARTETMSALNDAAQQRYEQNGVEWFQWATTPSDRLCPFCAGREGNVYEVGKVRLPAHPRCRCIPICVKARWLEKGLIDTAAIAERKQQTLDDLAARGLKPDYRPSAWERKAGLEKAPEPVWKPGDPVPKAPPRQRPQSAEAAPEATPPKSGKVAAKAKRKASQEAGANPTPEPKPESSLASREYAKANFKLLGSGIEGEVYLDDKGRAIKYFDAPPEEDVLRRVKAAGEAGFGPKVYEITGDRKSLAMEFLDGYEVGIHPGGGGGDDADDDFDFDLDFDPTPYDRSLLRSVRAAHKAGWEVGDLHEDNVMVNSATGEIRFVDQGYMKEATPEGKAAQLLNRYGDRPLTANRLEAVVKASGTIAQQRELKAILKRFDDRDKTPISDSDYEEMVSKAYKLAGIDGED